jgi:hypothetical protein
MRISWLYLASRSERASEPVLICPQLVATARSAMVRPRSRRSGATSRRCSRLVRHLDGVERFGQRADLVDLDQDRVGDAHLDAVAQARGLVTNRSSPTSWHLSPIKSVSAFQPSQSSSAMPSSMEMIG